MNVDGTKTVCLSDTIHRTNLKKTFASVHKSSDSENVPKIVSKCHDAQLL